MHVYISAVIINVVPVVCLVAFCGVEAYFQNVCL